MFGGKRIDKARDAQRIREVQDLIRTIAGNVDDNEREMEQVKAMMQGRKPAARPREAPPAPVQKPPETGTPKAVPPPSPPKPSPVEGPIAPPRPPVVQAPPARERPVFCIHCGTRLPIDSRGCPVCASRNSRICPNCGTRVNITMVTCPICRRVMPPAVPYQRH